MSCCSPLGGGGGGGAALGFGLYADRPGTPGDAGSRYVTTDGGIEWVSDGTIWKPLLDGTVGLQVPLVAAFTDFGGGVWADAQGTIQGGPTTIGAIVEGSKALVVPVAAPLSLRVHFAPSALFTLGGPPSNGGQCGIFLRTTDAVRLDRTLLFGVLSREENFGNSINVTVLDQVNVTGAGPDNFANRIVEAAFCEWLRVDYAGGAAEFVFYTSPNGKNWAEIATGGNAGWLDGLADQIGIFYNPGAPNGSNSPALQAQFDSYDLS